MTWGPVSAVAGYFPDLPDGVPRAGPPRTRFVRRRVQMRSEEARALLPPRERGIVTRICDARLFAGLTQMDLAVKLGCSKFMVCAAEIGRARVGEKWISRVLAACGLPADWKAT